ncbi:cdc20/fizzy protein cortex isoform X2 [Haematobia irritans]|uniref:cdc20/fizzy protein cortex isoform X2 n=1 Tax=Haematobia irritans TaxID=7368 RepID=UPI003F501E1D
MRNRSKQKVGPEDMIFVKKRADQWENEVTTKTHPPDKPIPISYGDRFIPRRFLLSACEKNLKFSTAQPIRDFLKLCSKENYWRENTFIPMINTIAEMKNGRIYSLVDPVVKSTGFLACTQYRNRRSQIGLDWPCKPRSRPCAYSDLTFDLPDYDSSFALELWDVSCTDDFCVANGKIFQMLYGDILCIEWTLSEKQIVCGTQHGTMYVLSIPELNTLKKIRKHQLPITIMRFSPTMRYLATGDSEGNIVIYDWSVCKAYFYVKSRRKLSVVFDWHPWTGVDLAISEDVPASIVILHVPSKKIVAYYQQNGNEFSINSISFSKITGELLVSTSIRDGGICSDYKVLVMSSLDRIVDILRIPDGGARFLTWSPDGTRVATTGSDETLTMWKFCPSRRTNCFKLVNGRSEGSSFETRYGNQFRKWCNLK